ncbi:MAG: translation initiation factor IF-3 [Candidatus Pacebacteria bacterium]|nr:translation initiation factor IF-3 [Candidatus Paceibacterota bacterium]
MSKETVRINNQIKAKELRVIGLSGENFGVISRDEALSKASEQGEDLIEISPNAKPPVAKIMNYGKFLYDQKKKQKVAKAKTHTVEVKSVQIKLATGEHDLGLKAKRASKWLSEGNRVKLELYLRGREKYLEENFLKDRLNRILNLITEEYNIADPVKKIPKGFAMIIEKKK